MSDDVDRALVLQEFHRRGFKLNASLVDDAVHKEIADHYAGDEKRFAESLIRKGVHLADYRRFVTEEITISAMLYQDPHSRSRAKQADWLASLRKAKQVEMVASATRG